MIYVGYYFSRKYLFHEITTTYKFMNNNLFSLNI